MTADLSATTANLSKGRQVAWFGRREPEFSIDLIQDAVSDLIINVRSMRAEKLLGRILAGAVRNVGFDDLIGLLQALGFKESGGRGSHRVFVRSGVAEILTLQQVGCQAKPYQVRQVVALIRQYYLDVEEEP